MSGEGALDASHMNMALETHPEERLQNAMRRFGPPPSPTMPGVESPWDSATPSHGLSASLASVLGKEALKSFKLASHRGHVAEVEDAVQLMEARGIPLNIDIMHSLVHACTKGRQAEKAEHYMWKIQQLGLRARRTTYNSIINAWAVVGNCQRADFWYNCMLSKGYQPDEVTYGTMCKALATAGDADGVEAVMAQVKKWGGQLNTFYFASLISACDKVHPPDVGRAERALEDLVREGLRPENVRKVFTRVAGSARAAQVYASFSRHGWGSGGSDEVHHGSSASISARSLPKSVYGDGVSLGNFEPDRLFRIMEQPYGREPPHWETRAQATSSSEPELGWPAGQQHAQLRQQQLHQQATAQQSPQAPQQAEQEVPTWLPSLPWQQQHRQQVQRRQNLQARILLGQAQQAAVEGAAVDQEAGATGILAGAAALDVGWVAQQKTQQQEIAPGCFQWQ